jgi:hypothetical protein
VAEWRTTPALSALSSVSGRTFSCQATESQAIAEPPTRKQEPNARERKCPITRVAAQVSLEDTNPRLCSVN